MNYQDIVKLAEGSNGKKEGALEKDAENVLNNAVYDSIVSGSYLNEFKKIAQRGQGLGVGGPPQGDLGADKCKCPDCGHTMAHVKGTPCQDVACPKCGAKMKGITVKTAEDMEKLSEAEILSAMVYDAIVEAAYEDEMTKIAKMAEKKAEELPKEKNEKKEEPGKDENTLDKKAEDLTTKIGTYLDTNKEDGQAVLASLIQKNKEKK